ncbi:MAG: hypothetical protein R3286_07595 [Gammaproteobacteria bacterium]|nr:hypothetical protein [Gammaproteobacteria bacterium]
MTIRSIKRLVLVVVALVLAFLLTRPGDYREVFAGFGDRVHDQWCAWSEPLGHRCDRWRKVRAVVDEARDLGRSIGEQLPDLPPPSGDTTPKPP